MAWATPALSRYGVSFSDNSTTGAPAGADSDSFKGCGLPGGAGGGEPGASSSAPSVAQKRRFLWARAGNILANAARRKNIKCCAFTTCFYFS